MGAQTATVETLTAEVRVLMVGNRQVTLSVYRQLDAVPSEHCAPFGRVCDSKDEHFFGGVFVVGLDRRDGALVRSSRPKPFRGRHSSVSRWGDFRPGDLMTEDAEETGPEAVIIRDWPTRDIGVLLGEDGPNRTVWTFDHSSIRQAYRSSGVVRWKSQEAQDLAREFHRDQVRQMLEQQASHAEWAALPLIVLAGLR